MYQIRLIELEAVFITKPAVEVQKVELESFQVYGMLVIVCLHSIIECSSSFASGVKWTGVV